MNVGGPFRFRRVILAAVSALLLSGCGAADSSDSTGATGAPSPPDSTAPDGAGTDSAGTGDSSGTSASPTAPASQFTGTIGGDSQLEGGCLWLDTDDERYELQLPDEFAVDTQSLTVSTPQGEDLAAGDTVDVTGVVVEDMVSVCQVGPILEVTELSAGAASGPVSDY